MALASVLALLFFKPTLAQSSTTSESGCLPLASSSACPAFQAFYVGLPGLAQRFPFLQNVTDIHSFDAALNAYVYSPGEYLVMLQCADPSDSFTVPYARYSLTRLCATLIQDSDFSLPCNWQHSLTPLPLCKSTCLQWTDSINSITNDTSLCPNRQQRDDNLQNLLISSCNTWQGFNATTNCMLGLQNEPKSCGFGNDMKSACEYCKNNSDDCCSSLDSCGLTKGAIIGIVIGCIVAVALAGYAVFFFCCYRKKRVRNENFSFKTYIPSPSNEHDSSAFISTDSQQAFANDHPSRWSTDARDERFEQDGDVVCTEPLQPDERLFEVIHPYPKQNPDELHMNKRDIVYMLLRFDDGWAFGCNLITDMKGAFPLVCVAPISKELLNQLSLDEEEDAMSEQDTDLYIQRLRNDIRRSRSLTSMPLVIQESAPLSPGMVNAGAIPKRTASIVGRHNDFEDPPFNPSQDSYEMSRQRMSKYQLSS